MKVIAFDFDGVVVSSKHEPSMIAIRTYEKITGKKLKTTPRKFFKYRAFIKNAEDFYAALRLLDEGGKIDFDSVKRGCALWKAEAARFAKNFYLYRTNWIKADARAWLRNVPLYPEMDKIINRLVGKNEVFITTTRDLNSARFLLKHYKINIKPKNLLSRAFTTDKVKQLSYIARRERIALGDIIFIDDIFDHVIKIKALGCKVVLSGWGFSNAAQRKQARKMGIPVAMRKNLEKIIEKL